ncbi:MAG: hypothetical protein J6I55_06730 [Ruminococcus sp.]|jgi:DNA-entry nuclease|nr:hypothetical protein [Ruminococcus sp.]
MKKILLFVFSVLFMCAFCGCEYDDDYSTKSSEINQENLSPYAEISTFSENTHISDTYEEHDYVLNTNTKVFHNPLCADIKKMKEKNKKEVYSARDELLNQGFKPCGHCNP